MRRPSNRNRLSHERDLACRRGVFTAVGLASVSVRLDTLESCADDYLHARVRAVRICAHSSILKSLQTEAVETQRIRVDEAQSIVLDWYPADAGAPAAVFIHGLGSHRGGEKALHFAERFNAKGWAFASVDLRGHGESDGMVRDLTLSRMLADLRAAMHWIAQHGQVERPVLIGSSMGGVVIAWYAAAHPREVGPLVMIAPALSFPLALVEQIGPEAMQDWQRSGIRRWRSEWIDLDIGYGLIEDAANYDPRLLQRLPSDMLILHGMQDQAIDWQASVAFAEAYESSCDLLLIKDGDHRLTDYKAFLFDTLWAWLHRKPRLA
jgi:uncharacterized protein